MSPFASRQLPVWIFAVLLAVAFAVGLRTTHDLDFPGTDWEGVGIDLYRDISSAQTMIDEGYGPDPTYRGERTWYNPLTPALSAVASAVTGAPVPRVAARLGAYVNLLGPIAFFLLCAALFDRWTALFAGAGFLFLVPGALPSWISATYSPWLMPVNFVQAWFYFTLLAFHRARRDGRLVAFLLPGVLWGVTFLGHTAPALVIGGMALLWIGHTWWRARRGATGAANVSAVAQRVGLMMLVALVVSAPMVAIIVGHYGLRIQNPDPSAYSEPLLVRQLPTLVRLHLTIPTAIALFGFFLLLKQRSHRAARRLVLAWMVAAGGFLAYSYVRLALKAAGVTLPSIVPSFHFFFYLKAAAALLFGLGVMGLARVLAARIGARRGAAAGSPELARTRLLRVRAVATGLLVLLLAVQAPAYLARRDFGASRQDAQRTAAMTDEVRAYTWLRDHLTAADTVLASDADGATIVCPSGAKVVAIFTGFSNPYVALAPRTEARDRLAAALTTGDMQSFRELARAFGVAYVLTSSSDPTQAGPGGVGATTIRVGEPVPAELTLVFASGERRVYRIRDANGG